MQIIQKPVAGSCMEGKWALNLELGKRTPNIPATLSNVSRSNLRCQLKSDKKICAGD